MSAAGPVPQEDAVARDGDVRQPSPEDCGWVHASDLNLAQNTGLAVFPRSGRCSVGQCSAVTSAAVQRAPSRTAPGHWQLYCGEHAHERGVDIVGNRLGWADGFPLTARGESWPR